MNSVKQFQYSIKLPVIWRLNNIQLIITLQLRHYCNNFHFANKINRFLILCQTSVWSRLVDEAWGNLQVKVYDMMWRYSVDVECDRGLGV